MKLVSCITYEDRGNRCSQSYCCLCDDENRMLYLNNNVLMRLKRKQSIYIKCSVLECESKSTLKSTVLISFIATIKS